MTTMPARYHREWREKNPESFKASQEKYLNSEHGKRAMFKRRLEKTFGITIEQYDNLMASQGNRCGICGVHQSELDRRFDIDHDHATGKVRGLLCNRCNQGIGLLGDSMIQAIAYLKRGNNG